LKSVGVYNNFSIFWETKLFLEKDFDGKFLTKAAAYDFLF
jgi:hypothetical protein